MAAFDEPEPESTGGIPVHVEHTADFHSPINHKRFYTPKQLTMLTLWVEGGLVLLAILAGWLGCYDHNQPLLTIDGRQYWDGLKWGLLGMIPMMVYLLVFIRWTPKFLQPVKDVVENQMGPSFAACSMWQIVFIAFMAGFCEELFFRWCLQGGLEHYIGGAIGTWMAIFISSMLFGVCHWMNSSYALSTMVISLFLGWMMVATGNWLAPAITHFLFDLVAIYYIARIKKDEVG